MRVSFSISLRTERPLAEVVASLQRGLNVAFERSEPAAHVWDEMEIMVAEALGLELVAYSIVGTRLPHRLVRLTGGPSPTIAKATAGEYGTTDISEYVVKVVNELVGSGWYVPSLDEARAEAGLPPRA